MWCVTIIEPRWDSRPNEALQGSNTTGDLVYIKYGHRGTALSFTFSLSFCVCVFVCACTRRPQTSRQAQHVALAETPLWARVCRREQTDRYTHTHTYCRACVCGTLEWVDEIGMGLRLWSHHQAPCFHMFVKAFHCMLCQPNCDTVYTISGQSQLKHAA